MAAVTMDKIQFYQPPNPMSATKSQSPNLPAISTPSKPPARRPNPTADAFTSLFCPSQQLRHPLPPRLVPSATPPISSRPASQRSQPAETPVNDFDRILEEISSDDGSRPLGGDGRNADERATIPSGSNLSGFASDRLGMPVEADTAAENATEAGYPGANTSNRSAEACLTSVSGPTPFQASSFSDDITTQMPATHRYCTPIKKPFPLNVSASISASISVVAIRTPWTNRQSSEDSDANWIDHAAEPPKIKSQPYCSQQCLLALRDDGPLDTSCPNCLAHLKRRIKPAEFHALIREQLSRDRGPDASCRPLYKKGSCGAAFKIHLLSHGYTLFAKGVERNNSHKLEHEYEVYHRLHDIQGNYIPVCLGIVVLDPKYPYYYDEGVYTHMLLLSWAGQPISEVLKSDNSASVIEMTSQALRAIHLADVLHCDVEPRNILWNKDRNRPMLVDFERAKMRNALSAISPNLGLKKEKAWEEQIYLF
ncbi:predicted protein [Histoplasma mississippiense (nom. inval.)]|uniref:predicted protein n=1 Tax=Ajellomyces capsulatus (strain NAm1 / WU24) TaxID=2059318 RepID=UPI000157CF93|nr:predicted protein [Histoplasma mississippiense (nom. inval.)]EDN11401.1 predicted protein [Histoplasma mississippiense (nom. inval.)]